MKTVTGRRYAVLVVLGLSLALPARARAQDTGDLGIALGAKPPAVTIEDLDGRPVDLGQIVGKKPVLFEFWATWCPLCEALLPKLEAAHARYGSQMDFVAVAVAINQSQSSVKRHLALHPIPFRFLWDSNGNAVRAFQAPSTSYVVVLDASGKVAYTGSGDEQDIDAAVRRVVTAN
ncbi:MAG TPA: TlpA disulfide reductase family protein [Gemmatimonadales bacterium]|nr:TlpA disulfide reductase family protein [Gemmatimonadales bacterium]